MLTGEFDAPGAEIVTEPEYVPGDKPLAFAEIVAVPGVEDDETVAFSHEAEVLAPQVVVAPPADTLIVCPAGTEPPSELNVRSFEGTERVTGPCVPVTRTFL